MIGMRLKMGINILVACKKQLLFTIFTLIYIIFWSLSIQYIYIIINIILFIIILVWCGYTQKYKPLVFFVLFMATTSMIGIFLRYPIAAYKFQMLEEFYQHEAIKCCLDFQELEDVPYYNCKGNCILSNWGNIELQKTNGTISIYFPIAESFFNSYGYLYVSNMEHNQENCTFSLNKVDYCSILNNNWAFIKLF